MRPAGARRQGERPGASPGRTRRKKLSEAAEQRGDEQAAGRKASCDTRLTRDTAASCSAARPVLAQSGRPGISPARNGRESACDEFVETNELSMGSEGVRLSDGHAGPASARDAWLRRLASYCWRHRRAVILALAGSLAATLATAVIPLILGRIVDDAILTRHQPIWLGATVLIVAGLVNFGGVYTRRYQGGRLSLDVQHDMRTELFTSLSRLDGARQDQLSTGQIVSRAISDLNMIQGLLGMVPMLLGNAVLFAASIAIMAF